MSPQEQLENLVEQLHTLEDAIEYSCNEWQSQIFTVLENLKALREDLSLTS